jgi:hypothetical protein
MQDDKSPVVSVDNNPKPPTVRTLRPYINKRRFSGRGILTAIAGLLSLNGKNQTAGTMPTALGATATGLLPFALPPGTLHMKPKRASGAVRKVKAHKRAVREIQQASKKANRGTKGRTKRKGEQ